MSIMSWNCQGLGRPQGLTIQRLREMRKNHFPEILFLMETKNCRHVLVDLQVWLGYDKVYTVEPCGLSGGLALFCKKNIRMDVRYADKNLLDCLVQFGDWTFFLSCVYGEPANEGRSIVWERLIRTGVNRREAWCLIGDFNEIRNNSEKIGGPRRAESSFEPFLEMLKFCNMEELSSKGDRFSWGGKRFRKWIQCCLDRSFGNEAWASLFPSSNQTFLEKRGSDHRPVWLNLGASPDVFKGQFKFDKKFLMQPDTGKQVINAWSEGRNGNMMNVSQKIRNCRNVLSRWKKKKVFNAKDKIHLLQQRLEWLQSRSYPCFFMINVVKKDLIRAYKEEELFWKQKSRDKWLNKGDRNSKFFHSSVKVSRCKNHLLKLKNRSGQDQWSEGAKAEVALDYFAELFKSSNPSSYSPVFQSMIPTVTEEMNIALTRAVSSEEVQEAMFSINPDSAPGPDGMTGLFFQRFWEVIGEQVSKEIKEVFSSGEMPKDWNFTYLCLIPKIQNPELMSDLRPISLCSVLYKCVSKILVNRLKPWLQKVVSINQSAFVSERYISDNIIIAHEAVHALKTNPTIAKEFIAVKTDMSKAYDRVEWSYLRSLLLAMGFCLQWVEWIMMCISSASFAVLINDQPFGLISPQRGLRQGDPLSPFLFVLCTEGLTHLLNVAERNGLLNGMRFSDDGPSIQHMFFADDSLFFCKADVNQARALKKILNFYGKATGQVINLQKSSISFGDQVEQGIKVQIQESLEIVNEGGTSKYLGVPECFSGSKVELLSYLKDRTQTRLDGWYLKHLSQAGKEVLLKSTASAMPIYPMTCFRLPKTLISKLSSIFANFWWGSDAHLRKIHWVAWEKMCLPKH